MCSFHQLQLTTLLRFSFWSTWVNVLKHKRYTRLNPVEQTLRHDNVVKALRGVIQRLQLYGVFELLDHNMMEELLSSAGGLDSVVLRKYSYQILRGLDFLHSRNVSIDFSQLSRIADY